MTDDDGNFTPTQNMVLAILPMITAPISICGSSSIIYLVFRSSRTKPVTTKQRLLIGLSVADIFVSTAMMFTTMAAPKGTDHVWNPQGNTFTCELQGFFFFTFHLMVPLYNASLCIFYMLVVKYSIADDIMAKRYEPYLHAGPICWALLIGSIILAMDHTRPDEL